MLYINNYSIQRAILTRKNRISGQEAKKYNEKCATRHFFFPPEMSTTGAPFKMINTIYDYVNNLFIFLHDYIVFLTFRL